MDEPCAVHYVGILQTRDASFPTSAQVYNYTGLNGLSSDFNGTINVTQAGIPFSSGQCPPLVTPAKMYAWHISLVTHHNMESLSCLYVTVTCKVADCFKLLPHDPSRQHSHSCSCITCKRLATAHLLFSSLEPSIATAATTKHDTGHVTFTAKTCINSCHAAAGSCGITANTLYDVYLVAQDFITPIPNLQTSPTQGLLNTSDTSGDFSCTAGIFTSMLKPDIVPVASSPGLPTSQLYGNWSTTRCAMQNMSVSVNR